MTGDLITQARTGDEQAFRQLVEPHERELQVHCYRMLGSVQDAEDAVQETLLAVWRNLDSFEERATLRTWLYRIATRRCLNALRSASRRPPVTAFGVYQRDPHAALMHANGLMVLTLAGDQICAITRFDNSVLSRFGLPRSLPA